MYISATSSEVYDHLLKKQDKLNKSENLELAEELSVTLP